MLWHWWGVKSLFWKLCNATLWKWLVSAVQLMTRWRSFVGTFQKVKSGGSKRIRGWQRIFRGNGSGTICNHHHTSNNSNPKSLSSLLKRRRCLWIALDFPHSDHQVDGIKYQQLKMALFRCASISRIGSGDSVSQWGIVSVLKDFLKLF